jgi:hypothetical protein
VVFVPSALELKRPAKPEISQKGANADAKCEAKRPAAISEPVALSSLCRLQVLCLAGAGYERINQSEKLEQLLVFSPGSRPIRVRTDRSLRLDCAGLLHMVGGNPARSQIPDSDERAFWSLLRQRLEGTTDGMGREKECLRVPLLRHRKISRSQDIIGISTASLVESLSYTSLYRMTHCCCM